MREGATSTPELKWENNDGHKKKKKENHDHPTKENKKPWAPHWIRVSVGFFFIWVG